MNTSPAPSIRSPDTVVAIVDADDFGVSDNWIDGERNAVVVVCNRESQVAGGVEGKLYMYGGKFSMDSLVGRGCEEPEALRTATSKAGNGGRSIGLDLEFGVWPRCKSDGTGIRTRRDFEVVLQSTAVSVEDQIYPFRRVRITNLTLKRNGLDPSASLAARVIIYNPPGGTSPFTCIGPPASIVIGKAFAPGIAWQQNLIGHKSEDPVRRVRQKTHSGACLAAVLLKFQGQPGLVPSVPGKRTRADWPAERVARR